MVTKRAKEQTSLETLKLSDQLFEKLSRFIETHIGIKMAGNKRIMLQARLMKRLRILGIQSFEAYYDYVFHAPDPDRTELHNMIDAITTNKTDFFRESKHFEYLSEVLLPQWLSDKKRNTWKKTHQLTLWCAGCSTGEEPYTLAMVLQEFADQHSGFDFSIIATDISTRVLNQAKSAIYEHNRIEPVPENYRKKYLLRHKNAEHDQVRIAPELRSKVIFERLNLNDRAYPICRDLDIIFCRNVIIYFERPLQERIIQQLCEHLKPDGHLFTGHSEALNGMELPLTSVARTIYQKTAKHAKKRDIPVIALKPPELYFSEHPSVVSTLLGSCVAITMYNRRRGIGAICHALLPEPDDAHSPTLQRDYITYITYAIPEMVKKMKAYGISLDEIEVKLFGGAEKTVHLDPLNTTNFLVGSSNVKTALQVLEAEHLKIKTTEVGGLYSRKILFHTHTGEVWLKRMTA